MICCGDDNTKLCQDLMVVICQDNNKVTLIWDGNTVLCRGDNDAALYRIDIAVSQDFVLFEREL